MKKPIVHNSIIDRVRIVAPQPPLEENGRGPSDREQAQQPDRSMEASAPKPERN